MVGTFAPGGAYLLHVWHVRQKPGVQQTASNRTVSMDNMVLLRAYSPQSFEDLKKIAGKTVWMRNGYTMAYFPVEGGRIAFAHPAGVVPSIQKMEIKRFVKAATPATVDDGMSHGTAQAFALFTLPGSANQYAVAAGAINGAEQMYFCDLLFYYDDPHGIYGHWTQEVWQAIDAHQVRPGMSELQTRMAIGQKTHASNHMPGDRTVDYDQAGRTWTVTYKDDKAAEIKAPQ